MAGHEKIMKFSIPKEITDILATLTGNGFDAYVVGGSVRDLLRGLEPKDWDIATGATPEEIQKLFSESVYENEFGTVLVKLKPRKDAESTRTDAEKSQRSSASGLRKSSPEIVEVTTFRKEEKYSDLRRPDKVTFTKTIEEDLARRDFTINALALSVVEGIASEVIDPFGGQKDLKDKIVRAVGDPGKRFGEDALRLMRAVRIAAELGFQIEEETENALKESASLLEKIANERIRDEFTKIIMAQTSPARGKPHGAKWGIEKLEDAGLLQYIIPELREGIGMTQNKHHIYSVWEHNVLSLDYAARQGYSLEVRLAALLHDVGKPRTKDGEGLNSTFYNHEVVGARMTREIMTRLHFSKEIIKKVTHLIRYHMFYYNVDEVTAAGVRRFLRRVGSDNVSDLIKLREADRIGSGVPKAVPYKLRHFLFMIEKVRTDPIDSKMLKISGDEIMELLKLEPSPKVGGILAILLEDVLDDPKKNMKEYLWGRAKELGDLDDEELERQARAAKERKEEFESGLEAEIKKKYYVK